MVKLWCKLIIAKRRTWTQCPLVLQERVRQELASMGCGTDGERL